MYVLHTHTHTLTHTHTHTHTCTHVCVHRFATQRAEPPVDASQDITSASASHVNGVTTISFNRPRDSGDSNDISLDVCRFFLFAFNGPINFATGSAGYHGLGTMFRAPSAERICIPTSAQCFAGGNC